MGTLAVPRDDQEPLAYFPTHQFGRQVSLRGGAYLSLAVAAHPRAEKYAYRFCRSVAAMALRCGLLGESACLVLQCAFEQLKDRLQALDADCADQGFCKDSTCELTRFAQPASVTSGEREMLKDDIGFSIWASQPRS